VLESVKVDTEASDKFQKAVQNKVDKEDKNTAASGES
jgi:hypothetical protein